MEKKGISTGSIRKYGFVFAEEALGGAEVLKMNGTLEAGEYRFKLYAAVTSEGLAKSGLADDISKDGGAYVILSIEKIDGIPMPKTSIDEYSNVHFFISPLIPQ